MSKTIELSLKIAVSPTKDHPPFNAALDVSGIDTDGKKWNNTFKAGGNSEIDAINTVCRRDLLPKAISAIAMVVSQPTPSFKQEKKPTSVTQRDIDKINTDIKKGLGEHDVPAEAPSAEDALDDLCDKARHITETGKFTEIRAFVKEQGLSVKFANMIPREKIAEMIIEALENKEKSNA